MKIELNFSQQGKGSGYFEITVRPPEAIVVDDNPYDGTYDVSTLAGDEWLVSANIMNDGADNSVSVSISHDYPIKI